MVKVCNFGLSECNRVTECNFGLSGSSGFKVCTSGLSECNTVKVYKFGFSECNRVMEGYDNSAGPLCKMAENHGGLPVQYKY